MPKLNPDPLLYTVEQAAEKLTISRSLCYRLVAEGVIGSMKVGRLRRVPAIALAQYIEHELAVAG